MRYSNLVNLVPFGTLLKYNPTQDKFYYIEVSSGIEEFYGIPVKEFVDKPLYFSKPESQDIDLNECHKKFENLIYKSLKFGYSFDIIKLSTFYKEINKEQVICLISLRPENNIILNLGFPIFDKLLDINVSNLSLLRNLLSDILNPISSDIILLNRSLEILFINKDTIDSSHKKPLSHLLKNEDLLKDIKLYVSKNIDNQEFKHRYTIGNRIYNIQLLSIDSSNNQTNLYLLILEDVTDYINLVQKAEILNKELELQKDKINVILKGYKKSVEDGISTDNPNIDLVKRITTATIKGKVKSITPMDHQLIGILKDIEDLKKDYDNISSQLNDNVSKYSDKISNLEAFVNKTDIILGSIQRTMHKIEEDHVTEKDINIMNIISSSPRNEIIIFFVVIIVSAVLFENLVMNKIKEIINDPSIVIEEVLEE